MAQRPKMVRGGSDRYPGAGRLPSRRVVGGRCRNRGRISETAAASLRHSMVRGGSLYRGSIDWRDARRAAQRGTRMARLCLTNSPEDLDSPRGKLRAGWNLGGLASTALLPSGGAPI